MENYYVERGEYFQVHLANVNELSLNNRKVDAQQTAWDSEGLLVTAGQ